MSPRCGGLLYGGELSSTASAPARRACAPSRQTCRVSVPPQPTTIGILPRFVCTAPVAARYCSSGVIAAASPVEPQMISASVPDSMWNSTRSARTASLTPLSSNGVMSATPEPSKRGLAICSEVAEVVQVAARHIRRRIRRQDVALRRFLEVLRHFVLARVGEEGAEHGAAALLALQVLRWLLVVVHVLLATGETHLHEHAAGVLIPFRHSRLPDPLPDPLVCAQTRVPSAQPERK